MVIINTVQQYSHLETLIQKNDSIVLQVNSDVNLHSIENRISLLYIWVGDEEFMLPINHSESTMEFKNIITKKIDIRKDLKLINNIIDKYIPIRIYYFPTTKIFIDIQIDKKTVREYEKFYIWLQFFCITN